jgi:hypothetical protein
MIVKQILLNRLIFVISCLFLSCNGSISNNGISGAAVFHSERSNIESFKVMDLLEHATHLESTGRHICHMEVIS